ncbi:MAG: DJ-1/PfpI family protein, partial [Clostridia bacterium]|nr:DJ-1/PfpI family protein [Clostridia bacterium]
RRAGVAVTTVAIGTPSTAVEGAHGITVLADITEAEYDLDAPAEMLILPGGMPGAANLDSSAAVDAAIAHAVRTGAYLAAICAAPMILGHRGLLYGRTATCFPGFEGELAGAELAAARVVCDGKIITAAGMGVALDFGLALVAALCGEEKAAALRAAVQASA